MSLLRNTNGNNTAQQNQNNTQQQNQNNNNNNNQQGSRFGNRFGGNNNNNQQANNNRPSNNRLPSPSRATAFNGNPQLAWMLTPLHRTVVRFELQGLGDPFYRLLGHPINKEYGISRNVAATLEKGGEHVDAIKSLLDKAWAGYELSGAMLVYNWNVKTWSNIAKPVPMPNAQDWLDNLTDDEDDYSDDDAQNTPPPAFKVLRAMDIQLTLNVLARARSQVLLAKAPLVLSQQYLNRCLVTDDPRLVELAQATGSIEDA